MRAQLSAVEEERTAETEQTDREARAREVAIHRAEQQLRATEAELHKRDQTILALQLRHVPARSAAHCRRESQVGSCA